MATRGGDKLRQKRKGKSLYETQRKLKSLSPHPRVLIVCEGEKTEPYYLKSFKRDNKINTANVQVADNTAGSSPDKVLNYAIELYEKSCKEVKHTGVPCFEYVFCVIDKDKHPTYEKTLQKAISYKLKNKKHKLEIITSVPCFELWILLHFCYTSKDYYCSAQPSICKALIHDLKSKPGMDGYEKGLQNIYKITKDRIETASVNAQRLEAHCQTGNTDSPSTKMHKLLQELKDIKNR